MEIRKRLIRALALLGVVSTAAVVGFLVLGEGVSLLDAIYMVVISLTGVGYFEVVSTAHSPALRAFNIVVLVVGVGTMLYVFTLATAFVVDGELTRMLRRRRMQRRIAKMTGHYVVCGAGDTGSHVIRELGATGHQVIATDLRQDRLDALGDVPWLAAVEGDATDAETLELCAIERARGIVAALPSEKDNLVVTVTARQRVPSLRIVARHVAPATGDRLRKAGADATVSPTFIGGMRLASEIARPHVVGFLDRMLREPSRTMRIEEIRIPERSPWAGRELGRLGLRGRFGLTCLAVQPPAGEPLRFGPGDEDPVAGGSVVIVMGDVERIVAARAEASPLES